MHIHMHIRMHTSYKSDHATPHDATPHDATPRHTMTAHTPFKSHTQLNTLKLSLL